MKKNVLFLSIFIIGLCIMLYPVVSQIVAYKTQSRAIVDYQETVIILSTEEKEEMIETANQYNESLVSNDENLTSYVDLLNIGEVMAYIEIPKINVKLPIYHGTSDAVLSRGLGHIETTSLPVGGESTHAVLTGHTGLPEANLLTDLTKMEIGDLFYLNVLDEILAYEVDQIKVVLPEETSDLQIVPGEDYVTLVTCTPYGINTHRLLVRGTRVEYVLEVDEDTEEENTSNHTMEWGLLIVGGIVVIIIVRKKGRR